MEPTTVYVWSSERPTAALMDEFNAAAKEAGVRISILRAIPGCRRALSLEGRPPFVCEWADINGKNLAAKVKWAATGDGGRPHTMAEWLSEVMGCEVREVV